MRRLRARLATAARRRRRGRAGGAADCTAAERGANSVDDTVTLLIRVHIAVAASLAVN